MRRDKSKLRRYLPCLLLIVSLPFLLGATVRDHAVWWADGMPAFVESGSCVPTVPSSSTTLDAFACKGYMLDAGTWRGIDQGAVTVGPLNAGDGTYWLAIHASPSSTVGGWTRQAQSHYLWIQSATFPVTPAGALIFAEVTVSTVVTAVNTKGLTGNRLGSGPLLTEVQQHLGALHGDLVVSGCAPSVPSSSTTFDAFACTTLVTDTSTTPVRLKPAVQWDSTLGPLTGGDGTYWLAIHEDRTTAVGGWTRQTATHYLWQKAASKPAEPANGFIFAQATVATVITAVSRERITGLATPACTNTAQYPNLQAAINAATAGDVLCVTGSETIAGLVTIDKALTLRGRGATLNFTTDATDQGIYITASDVHISGLRIIGPGSSAEVLRQFGIFADGPDVDNYLSDITIRDTHISDFGEGHIQLRFVENFTVTDNHLEDAFRYGVLITSGRHGAITENIITRIDNDGVTLDDSYGITLTKNNGTEAVKPTSHHITVANNVISESIVWACIDTHGGHDLTIIGNTLTNCRFGLNITSYIGGPGGENRGPVNVAITGNSIFNDHGAGETVTEITQGYCIGINGNITNLALGQNITVTGNICDGFGDEDAGIADTFAASLTAQYISGLTITGNHFQNNHRHGMLLFSIAGIQIVGNTISTITGGAAPVAATGTITLTGLPVATETVTVNGAVWTWVAAATNPYEVTIGADAAGSATNLQAALGSNSEQDGSLDVATFEDGGSQVDITFAHVGRSGNSFTLAEASSNLTVSGATLTGGAAGSAGIQFDILSGGSASNGLVANNQFSMTGYTAMQMDADNTALDFDGNRVLAGTPYDLQGSAGSPQSGAGNITRLVQSVWVKNPASIADNASETIYLPAPGMSAVGAVSITPSLPLDGLILSARPQDGGFVAVQLQNESGGAIDLAETTWYLTGHRVAGDR